MSLDTSIRPTSPAPTTVNLQPGAADEASKASSPAGLGQVGNQIETHDAPESVGCFSSILSLFSSCFSCFSIFRWIGEALGLISPADPIQIFSEKWGIYYADWVSETQGKEMIDEFHNLDTQAQARVRDEVYNKHEQQINDRQSERSLSKDQAIDGFLQDTGMSLYLIDALRSTS